MTFLMIWFVVGLISGCITVAVLRKASNDLTLTLAVLLIALMTVQGFFSIIFAIPFLIGFLVNFDGERQ